MLKQRFNLICSIVLLALLGGCMQPSKQPNTMSKQARSNYLQHLQHWQANGRVSIRTAEDNINASFTWRQDLDKYHTHFYSAFSNESLTIQGDQQHITAVTNNGEQDQEVKIEQNLPLAQLAFWLKGMPTPNSKPQSIKYDAQNQLLNLIQDGWTIEYQSYSANGPITLPEKLTATDGNTKVKLLIRKWDQ
jgi:outer membrane lipoprotein LolB